MEPENYPQHKEPFEVVMLKKGVSSLDAKPEDFKRVPVEATNSLAAQLDDTVAAEKDYDALFATKPGVHTDPEIRARSRQLDGAETDRTKL